MVEEKVEMQKISTEEEFDRHTVLCTALYKHLCYCPPHGPFAKLAALSFVRYAAETLQVKVSPVLTLQVIRKTYYVDHMRHYPPFFVAADVTLVDAEKLASRDGATIP